MRAQIDKICNETGVWPHAVLSAHAHNFQRFTRVHQSMEIPYIVAGNGGHNVARLKREPDAVPRRRRPTSPKQAAPRVTKPRFGLRLCSRPPALGRILCDWKTMMTRTTAICVLS
jgi:hypothetical protein